MEKTIIELKNIVKYHKDKLIINNVSLTAKSKDVTAIIGSSGAGKSTFLRCINLLNNFSEGQIFLEGNEVPLKKVKNELFAKSNKDLINLRQKIGFVFQDFNLWSHKTVTENITEAPINVFKVNPKVALEKAEFLLNKVHLFHRKDAYPKDLSGGEQQRVAIARALAIDPLILLLDEPTSALDPEKTKDIAVILQTLADEGMTMVVVTHEMGFCKNIAKKVIFFNEGKIEEEGTPKEIFQNPKSTRLKEFIEDIS